MKLRDRAAVCLLVAVAGLLGLAMTGNGLVKMSSNLSTVTFNGRGAKEAINRFATRNQKTVGVTRAVLLAVPIQIVDARHDIKLNWRSFLQVCSQSAHTSRLPEIGTPLHTSRQTEIRRRVEVGSVSACVIGNEWRLVKNRMAGLAFRDHPSLYEAIVTFICRCVPDIFAKDSHVSGAESGPRKTRECLKQLGWAIMDDNWLVRRFKIPLSLQISPDRHTQITDATHCNDTQQYQLKLSSSAEFVPVAPKGVLLLLGGFLGGCVGFTALFACLLFGGGWRQVSGSLTLIV